MSADGVCFSFRYVYFCSTMMFQMPAFLVRIKRNLHPASFSSPSFLILRVTGRKIEKGWVERPLMQTPMYRPWYSPRRSSIVCALTTRRNRRRTKSRRRGRRGFHNNRKKRRPSLFRPKAVISHYNLITICILITILFHTVRKRFAFGILQMIRTASR